MPPSKNDWWNKLTSVVPWWGIVLFVVAFAFAVVIASVFIDKRRKSKYQIANLNSKIVLYQQITNSIEIDQLHQFYLTNFFKKTDVVYQMDGSTINKHFIVCLVDDSHRDLHINLARFNNYDFELETFIFQNEDKNAECYLRIKQFFNQINSAILVIEKEQFEVLNNFFIANLKNSLDDLLWIDFKNCLKNFNKKAFKKYFLNVELADYASTFIDTLLSFDLKKAFSKNEENFKKIRGFNLKLQEKNKPLLGMYNGFFGSKQSIQMRKLIYVEEKADSCKLCRPFENKVLSYEKNDPKYTTIYEAMEQGFNHLGCTHSKIDYLANNTILPNNRFKYEEKDAKFQLKIKQFKFETKIRELKFKLDNSYEKDSIDALVKQMDAIEDEYQAFLNTNHLSRNLERENYKNDDSILFS